MNHYLVLCLGLVLMLPIPAVSAQVAPITVWTAPGLDRIARYAAPANTPEDITIAAARGEYESFQIAARGELTNVDLNVSDLVADGGATIDTLTLYREHYVYVSQGSPDWEGSNRPRGVGWYADALIPFEQRADAEIRAVPVDIARGENQPFWIDVFVPRDALAATYTGSYTLTSDQGSASGTITLRVWDFELPLHPALYSDFLFWGEGDVTELLRHRVMPQSVNPAEEQMLIEDWGLNATGLGFWSGAYLESCVFENPIPTPEELQTAISQHHPDLLLYNFTADEVDICLDDPQFLANLWEWARLFHDNGVLNLVTMTPTSQLLDHEGRSAVDIWVMLPVMMDEAPDQVEAALERGEMIWSYAALVQDDYSPKWEIDFDPINYRIQPGFISQSLDLTGILYWSVDLWTDDPWHNVQTYTNDNGHSYPGDGMLLYPGEAVGVEGTVPSMRLKWIRDGVDDYDMIQILRDLGDEATALRIARSVGADWSHWTHDIYELEAARQELGNRIEQQRHS